MGPGLTAQAGQQHSPSRPELPLTSLLPSPFPSVTEGSTGKTCLMKAVLNLRDGDNACILPLLQIDRDSGNPQPLVNAQCTDEFYRGHSALHIAIEKRSLQCVRLLVENGADVHARACGHFFQKKSQGTCFYFGEEPFLDKLRSRVGKALPKVMQLTGGRAGP